MFQNSYNLPKMYISQNLKNCLSFIIIIISILPTKAQFLYKHHPECQKCNAEMVILNKDNGTIKYIQLLQNYSLQKQNLAQYLQKAYNLQNPANYKLLSKHTDKLGITHYRYQQLVNDIPILDGKFIVHEKNARIISINGTLYPVQVQSKNILFTERDALKIALNKINAEIYAWENINKENFIKYLKNDPSATFYPKGEPLYIPFDDYKKSGQHILVYKFDIYALKPLRRTEVFVNVMNGEIELTLEKIINSYSQGTAITKYSGTRPIITEYYNGSYRLRDGTRGNGVETYNLQNTEYQENAVDFTDSDNYWNNFNQNQDEVATDAHWATEKTYDYYYNIHGYNSIDNQGFKLISYVHYGEQFVNAFWDGYSMTYGDGNDTIGPFTTLDIVGHETTHGLSDFSANFLYFDEPGGLCEGFSDIFGTSIEFYARPERANWLCGEDISWVIRSLSDPKSCYLPDTYQGEYWWNIQDPHYWCGPFEYWFYLISEGGSGTNDFGYSYNIEGIGIEKAEQIAFRTLITYLVSNSNYMDARDYSILATIDLYGMCSDEIDVVTEAWKAIGLPEATSYNLSYFYANDSIFCSTPATVTFYSNLEEDATHFWLFGDGTVSTEPNPEHTYMNAGEYTIHHIVQIQGGENCQGNYTLTKENYIKVYEPENCSFTMPNTGSDFIDLCYGILYDDGGEQNNYSNYVNSIVTIQSPMASNIKLYFEYYNMESSYDYIRIYDGDTILNPVLAILTGSGTNYSVISSTNAITLQFVSNGSITYSGFKLYWECNLYGFPTVADFDFYKINNNQYYFVDLSENNPQYFLWNFNDGATSTLQNPLHEYTQNGLYDVSLTASNQFGTHTKTKYACINITTADVQDLYESDYSFYIIKNHNHALVKSSIPFYTINIFNTFGQLIKTYSNFAENTTEYKFPLTNFSKGLYLIQIQTKEGVFNKKIIL